MLHLTTRFVVLVLAAVFAGLLFAAPNVMPPDVRDSLPGWWPKQTINLGLDLQGGSYILLEVDLPAVYRDKAENLLNDVRRALRDERIGYTGLNSTGNAVHVQITDPTKIDAARTTLDGLNSPLGSILTGVGGSTLSITNDGGTFTLAFTEAALEAARERTMQQSIEIVRRRIDELGTREPTIQQEGGERILVQVPGLSDPKRLKDILGKTAKLEFRLVDLSVSVEQAEAGRVPPGSVLLESVESGPDGKPFKYLVQSRAMVTGDNLTNAGQSFDQRDNQPVVTFQFDLQGARRFADVTRENVGRPFAIVLDGKVISAPNINEPITGGSGQISGNFTVESANNLALLLRAGALPAPLKIIEERTVGAELGADSIAAGQVAALIGMAAVVVFMVLAYGLFGVFSVIALALNIVLIFAVMSGLGSTLTLPGIAGIVLTIGMAVDANVLIYERMKEEAAAGKPAISAMDAGFARALSTIIDSNLTTVLAVALLFLFGSGPVRGFAIALSIGIISSMFTAVTVTRLMISAWVRARRPKVLPI